MMLLENITNEIEHLFLLILSDSKESVLLKATTYQQRWISITDNPLKLQSWIQKCLLMTKSLEQDITHRNNTPEAQIIQES